VTSVEKLKEICKPARQT